MNLIDCAQVNAWSIKGRSMNYLCALHFALLVSTQTRVSPVHVSNVFTLLGCFYMLTCTCQCCVCGLHHWTQCVTYFRRLSISKGNSDCMDTNLRLQQASSRHHRVFLPTFSWGSALPMPGWSHCDISKGTSREGTFRGDTQMLVIWFVLSCKWLIVFSVILILVCY